MLEAEGSRQHSTELIALKALAIGSLMALAATAAHAWPDDSCVMADNGAGTIGLPPADCAYLAPDEPFKIIDGLPPGTTIELRPVLMAFTCTALGFCGAPGGDLGGEREDYEAELILELRGTGDLAGYRRILRMDPSLVTFSGPRNPGDPVQSFPTQVDILVGVLAPGDPDFATLQILAGNDLGYPSPGSTTLTRLGPPGSDFHVDSFFDVQYEITFVGAPGGALEGLSGTTSTAPSVLLVASGESTPCIQVDDGSGTAEMPPSSCEYVSPDVGEHYMIVDGLPPGSTMELEPRHIDFVCANPGCGTSGGSFPGGEEEEFTSTLVLQVKGTNDLGGFRRTLRVPIAVLTHTGARTAGDPIQSFPTDLYSLTGSLPAGDPDFQSLTITAGTGNALPSPGHTILRNLGDGTFMVDSFFDISYQIDFVGEVGGALDGLSGSTQDSVRVVARSAKVDPVEPDNGLGTATVPPEGGRYVNSDRPMAIIDGLPPATLIEIEASLHTFFCDTIPCSVPGGGLGGGSEQFRSTLALSMSGTGDLLGFQRYLQLPAAVQTDSGPRTGGSPMQEFDAELVSLQVALYGDPDFDTLEIRAGAANLLPSPGHTTLTDLGDGTFAVDSFFDIDYQIDFVGAPGSAVSGFSGSTTGEVRMTACHREGAPAHNITVSKLAEPQGATLFDYSGMALFSLADDGSAPNWRTFHNLDPGTYAVAESLPGDWSLLDLVCLDPDMGTTVDLSAAEATIDLDLGEAVACTFENGCQDLVLKNATLTGTRAFRSATTALLGPNLVAAGTSIEVAAKEFVLLRDGTQLGGTFVARTDASLTCP